MNKQLDICFKEACDSLDFVRKTLNYLPTSNIKDTPIVKNNSAYLVASAYVFISSSLEKYVKSVLFIIMKEITNENVSRKDIKNCLFPIVYASEIQSITNLKDFEKLWSKKHLLFTELDSQEIVRFDLNDTEIPLDGKTIRPYHLEMIWKIFGLEPDCFTNPVQRFTLIDIADGRNEVAHGLTQPTIFGANKSVTSTIKKIEDVEDIIVNLQIKIERYLDNKSYRK